MDPVTAPVGGADAIVSVPVVTPAEQDRTPISPSEAARQLSEYRWKRNNPEQEEPPAEQPQAAPPQESAQAESDPQPEAPAESTEQQPEPALPPIEPPRSWTKDEKERFQSLPRETQEYVAQREQEREREIRRSQNEHADKLKGLTAKEQALEQARQFHEAAAQQAYQYLLDANNAEFPDIKSWEDARLVAITDPGRATQWQIKQAQLSKAAQDLQQIQVRQEQERVQRFSDYASKQDELIKDKFPELADAKRSTEIANKAAQLLKDIGFDDKELAEGWNSPMLRDARIQQLILENVKYREAKANLKPAPKPAAPVLKPGTPKAPQTAKDAEIQELETRFSKSASSGNLNSLRDAAALLSARRAKSA